MIFHLHGPLPAEYLAVIQRLHELRTTLKFHTSDALNRWTGLLARSTAARVMVGTNKMEGVNVTQEEAIAVVDGEDPLSADDSDRKALQGYQSAMTYIVQLSKDLDYEHNEGTIKSLHFMLLQHDLAVRPGRWRAGPIHITNTATNEIVYHGPDVALVPGLIAELIDSIRQPGVDSLVAAALAHLNLTMIHPFSDGNGRMARALQTMVLSRQGILAPQFSSIEEYIGRHSAEYYAVLAEVGEGSWNPQNDPLPWIRFALTAHYRQATDLMRRTTDIARLWNALEKISKDMDLNERCVNALADAALGYPVRNSTYRQHADISNQVAKTDLKLLADMGLLVPIGERRGRYYTAGPLLKQVRQATRSPRTEPDPFVDVVAAKAATQAELPGFEAAP